MLMLSIASMAQTLYEVKYYDTIDEEKYKGLFFYTDDDNCFLRCVSKPKEDGTISYWEHPYQVLYQKEDGVNFMYMVPETSNDNDDSPAFPTFILAYSPTGEFENTPMVTFEDITADDYEYSEDDFDEVKEFKEVSLLENDEDYFLEFYDEDEDMYKQIMDARARLSNQNSGSKQEIAIDPNSPVTMHLIVVAATEDETIGTSVTTDMNLVKKNFSKYAEQLNIGYEETVINGSQFNKENVRKTIKDLSAAPNDIIVFVYTGHGFRYNEDTDVYPRMFLAYDGEPYGYEMTTTEAFEALKEKNARLTIFLSDCCNSNYGSARDIMEGATFATRSQNNNTDLNRLYSLFIKDKGIVRATAAKPGQVALCDASGGFLLTSVINNIKSQVSVMSKEEEPSWNKILDNASKYVLKKTKDADSYDGEESDPQVVVKSISINGTNIQAAFAEVSVDQESDDDDGDILMGMLCIFGPAVIIIGLIIAIIAILRKKKKQ